MPAPTWYTLALPMARNSGSIKNDLAAALAMTQQDLAELFGVSRRTIQRLKGDLLFLSPARFSHAAVAMYPKDPELAARLAAQGRTTLEQLGLVRPALPPPSAARPTISPTAPTPISPAAADSVVCAAADAMNLSPRALRPGLLAAFSHAHALGLSVEAVKAWLESGDKSL